jgi:N-acetylmuramoyl-L-alanine amidase
MSKWRNDFINKNEYSRPSTLLNGVKKIVLHWTANLGASAANHKKYFGESLIVLNRRKEKEGEKPTKASAHIFVDKDEAVCIIPLNEVAYHANDVQEREDGVPYRGVNELKPNANLLSIGVEMCVEKDGSFSPDTLQRTAEVIADLCKIYSLTENDIVRHFDVTHKNCPAPFVKDESLFYAFKNMVKDVLNPKPISYPGHVFKTGNKDKEMVLIQKVLKVPQTGVFDGETTRALKEFQKQNKLVSDGIVGPKTWSLLFK